MSDPYNLQRFVDAQDSVYANVRAELAAGRKRSHWMWFIFPQVAGLGFSAMAQRFAIGSRAEALAFLAHDVLGPRLIECTGLVMSVTGKTIHDILSSPDDLKFRSSMTLFAAVSDNPLFTDAIAKYFAGAKDQTTLDHLSRFDGLRRQHGAPPAGRPSKPQPGCKPSIFRAYRPFLPTCPSHKRLVALPAAR
jgi:uncharacterized protein (DUF1810 family)